MAAKGTLAAAGSMAGVIENYIIQIPLHRAGRLTSMALPPIAHSLSTSVREKCVAMPIDKPFAISIPIHISLVSHVGHAAACATFQKL